MSRTLAAVCFAALLAGCAQPIVKTTGPLSITRVDVSAAPGLAPHTDLVSLVRQTAPAQLVGAHEGKPAVLDLTLVDVHYKNPLASLLVGDANRLLAKGVLRDASGQEINRFDTGTLDQGAVNGIAGAVISAAQDRARVDRALARGLAKSLETRIYGKTTRVPIQTELAPRIPPAVAPKAPSPTPAATHHPLPKGAAGV